MASYATIFGLLSCPLLFLFVLNGASGQDPIVPIPQEVKDDIVERVDTGLYPSIALGAYDGGEIEYFVYGMQNLSTGTPATKDSIYDLGSISKTFAALLMGKLFTEQKLRLWDPLDDFLPDDLGLRDEDGTPIQLLHLATHTSGMPRMPANFDDDHPEDYYQDDLYEFLADYEPSNIGESYSYSNLGFGVLGDALAICQDDGRGYKQIIVEDIVEPMGIHMFFDDPANQDDRDNQAQGYRLGPGELGGGLVNVAEPFQNFQDAMAGAVGLRASIENLLAWGVAHLPGSDAGDQVLREAVEMATQRFHTDEDVDLGLTWVWERQGESTFASKDGQVGGFNTALTIDRGGGGRVVAVATNTGTIPVEDIANMLIPLERPEGCLACN